MACVSSASVSSLVEGSPTTIIKQRRGLRQGDPLSPLLFVVVMEYLSKLVHHTTSSRKLELYSSEGIPVESHLAFADDVTFFYRVSVKSFKALSNILEEFASFSGLKINCQKSLAVFSKRVSDGNDLASILGFQTKELPVRYLGTPMTDRLIRYKDCDGFLAELRSILTRWSSKKLSYVGRTQLVDWVFQGKFGYLSQSSIIPQAVLDIIQSITYQLIWGSQREVSWSSMIKPKDQGGMGVRDYKTVQQAVIIGRACRMWDREGIWSNWMEWRYIKDRPFSVIEGRQGDSSSWKATLRRKSQISNCAMLAANGLKSWIGKGANCTTENIVTTIRPDHPKD